MKRPALVLVAALFFTLLGACSKPQSESQTANAPAAAPAENEAAQNDSGTTTYYGSPDEQATD
jgi:uncharacterized lipoprotein YajG